MRHQKSYETFLFTFLGCVVSENPLEYDADWKCENFPSSCNFPPIPSKTIEWVETMIEKRIAQGPRYKLVNQNKGKVPYILMRCNKMWKI